MPSPRHLPNSSAIKWTPSDVKNWLTQLGMARYAKLLCDQHKVDGLALLMLQVIITGKSKSVYSKILIGRRLETATP